MEFLKPAILQVLSPECFDEFFVDFNFFHVECLKAAVSKGLGIGIIAGSLLVKVPQILKLYGAKSGEGITLISLMMEIFAISANVAYSYRKEFPFSAWGEGLFLAIQTAIIAALVLLYGTKSIKGAKQNGSAVRAGSFLVCYSAGLALLLSPIAPMELLWAFQMAIVPLIIISKLIQAVANYRTSSTGQLSAVTVFMLFFGAVARVFTSIQETGDTTIITTYIVSSLANGLISAQMLYYWKSDKATSSGRSKNKKTAKSKAKKQN